MVLGKGGINYMVLGSFGLSETLRLRALKGYGITERSLNYRDRDKEQMMRFPVMAKGVQFFRQKTLYRCRNSPCTLNPKP